MGKFFRKYPGKVTAEDVNKHLLGYGKCRDSGQEILLESENAITTEDIVKMAYEVDGDFIWIMSIRHYRELRHKKFLETLNGENIFENPKESGYGTLLGRKIAIVDFEHFGTAKI